MTFEEQLQRAFTTLTDRVRDTIAREAQGALITDLKAAVQAEREGVAGDIRQAVERDFSDKLHAAVAEAEARGRDKARQEGRELGLKEGRQEAEKAAQQAIESAKAAALSEAKSAGGAESDRQLDRLIGAIRSIGGARSLSEILDTLAGCAGREAARAGVLLVGGNRFRGWRFVGFGALEADRIEIPRDAAGVIADALRTGAVASGAAPTVKDLPPGHGSVAVPIAVGGQVVAVLYADQGVSPPAPGAEPPLPGSLEVLASYAGRCLEALTAIKAARVLTEGTEPSRAAAGRAAGDGASEESAAARRYARLLVSEIKLYHEADVVAGRRERDLTKRLGGEIARARALFEQRVAPQVRQQTDYFGEELVRTLADGDAGLLGKS
ncbi:MAG: hypothetical protein WBD07_14430 [Vicinamibacterales bacterium]